MRRLPTNVCSTSTTAKLEHQLALDERSVLVEVADEHGCRFPDPQAGEIAIASASTNVASAFAIGALPKLERLFIDNPSSQLKNYCSSKLINLNTYSHALGAK